MKTKTPVAPTSTAADLEAVLAKAIDFIRRYPGAIEATNWSVAFLPEMPSGTTPYEAFFRVLQLANDGPLSEPTQNAAHRFYFSGYRSIARQRFGKPLRELTEEQLREIDAHYLHVDLYETEADTLRKAVAA